MHWESHEEAFWVIQTYFKYFLKLLKIYKFEIYRKYIYFIKKLLVQMKKICIYHSTLPNSIINIFKVHETFSR